MSKIYILNITEVINQRISLSAYCLSTQKNGAHEHFIMSPISMEAQRTSKKKFCEIKWMMYVCRINVYIIWY